MNKTIYNTYVVMESQEQCDRMKQVCIDNNLPEDVFRASKLYETFSIWYFNPKYMQVTEQEWLELLKNN